MATTDSVEQVKARLRAVADQIQEMSRADGPNETFFQPFLQLLCSALHAPGGVVWYVDGDRLRPAHAVGGENLRAIDEPEASKLNLQLVTDSLVAEQTATYHSSTEVGLPEEFSLLVIPVKAKNKTVAAVELFQRGNISDAARNGYAQFVERMCGFATAFLERKAEAESVVNDDSFWTQFETTLLDLNRLLDTRHVCGVAANDGKTLLGVQRVSVAYKRGRRTDVLASSGVDEVQKRADQTRSLSRLAAETIKLGQPVIFTGTIDEFSKRIGELLDTHVRLSNARYVMMIPLFANDRRQIDIDPTSDEARQEIARKPIGCLIAEQLSDAHPPDDVERRGMLLADHLGASLSNARSVEQIPFSRTLRSAGALRDWMHGRKLLKTLLALAVLVATALVLAFVPWEYRVKADGRLMPVQQTRVYAPVDGEVESILVESGQQVSLEQPLVQLQNPELKAEIVRLTNERRESEKSAVVLMNQINELVDDKPEEAARLTADYLEARGRVLSLDDQLEILQQRYDRLLIRADRAGVIATFQLEELLAGRPVNRGELLLEIMQPDGEWRLELQVPEHRIGHIRRSIARQSASELPATYVLATATEKSYPGQLERLSTMADVSQQEQTNVVECYVSLDREERPDLSIGAEVTAKIDCGQRSLGYVLFGDVVEFFQKQMWW